MGFLNKILGGSRGETAKPQEVPPPIPRHAPANTSSLEEMIRVCDEYGREMLISREEWRDKVLMGSIQREWNDAEQLASLIIQAFNDGFFTEMVAPAERLAAIDCNPERSASLLAIAYLKTKRLDDSEKVLRAHMEKHGETGVALTNLAKVYAERGDHGKSLEVLWRGLQLDPNQDNAMGWYEVIHREQGGEEAGLEALRRVASLPKSWRPQLWLARDALKRRDLTEALSLYEQSLAAAPEPAPPDLLMQMSGDLGNAGHLPELLKLTLQRFHVHHHGLQVGNNLIKGFLELGQIEPARNILRQLYAQHRPDWKATLSFWDTEIAKLNVETTAPVAQQELRTALLTFEGPIWLPPESPLQDLFPKSKTDPTRIAFLGSSAELPKKEDNAVHQLSNAPGRLSRAIPLFLGEQVHLRSGASVRALIPSLQSNDGAFVFSGVPWSDEDAAHFARMTQRSCDYVAVTHLRVTGEPWKVELRLIRTVDGNALGKFEYSFPSSDPEMGLTDLSNKLVSLLAQQAEGRGEEPPMNYQVPKGPSFANYLLRLEQLLAVRAAALNKAPGDFLFGEHEIMDGILQLALECSGNVALRALLLETVRAMKRVRPEVVALYGDKLARLQREHPLPEPAHTMLNKSFAEFG